MVKSTPTNLTVVQAFRAARDTDIDSMRDLEFFMRVTRVEEYRSPNRDSYWLKVYCGIYVYWFPSATPWPRF